MGQPSYEHVWRARPRSFGSRHSKALISIYIAMKVCDMVSRGTVTGKPVLPIMFPC